MFAHGAQKMLGWFGGAGFRGTIGFFKEQMNIPAAVACVIIVAEFFGSISLLLGFFTRVAALLIAVLMLFAIILVHVPFGFFANWFGNKPGEGFEYHLLVIALCIVLFVRGAGAFSLDQLLYERVSSAVAGQSIEDQSPMVTREVAEPSGRQQ
jgi:putative oxidoreductase